MRLPELPRYVRAAPRIFYGIGVLDFVKNLVPMYILYERQLTDGIYTSLVPNAGPELFQQFLAAVVYAAGWFVSGVFALILLSIHDHVRSGGAPEADGGDARAPLRGVSE